MRKKQEALVSGKDVFVGLEDSKRTWKVCVRCAGQVVHETGMPARYEVLRAYLQGRYAGWRIRLMYEAGFGGFWLHDRLVADGIDCVVTPAHMVTQEKVNLVKTDRIDARRLAKNLENHDYTACCVPDRTRREDRQVSRTLTQVQRKAVATKNQLRKLLDFHGLNEGLPPGRWTAACYRTLRELAVGRSLRVSIDALLDLLAALEDIEARLMAELKVLSTSEHYQEPVQLKQSCPGVGWLSAIRYTLEWGALSRFSNGKKIAAFSGLTCREYSTGATVHRGRITGQSSGPVRGWLIQCAWRAIHRDPVLAEKFRRVWSNSGSKKKAIVAVARKLTVRLWAVEVTGHPYEIGVVQ